MRFLHCADLHLGTVRFGNDRLTQDFTRSFRRMAEDAVTRRVDAVIICGDLFDRSSGDLLTLHDAERTLVLLRYNGIEVIAIEGDHDARGTPASYLAALAREGLIKLLATPAPEGQPREWSEERKAGSYIDLEGVRFIGLGHRSAGSASRIGSMVEVIEPSGFTVAMMHAGIARPVDPVGNGLRGSELEMLREKVDYFALGHTHCRFSGDGWIYNPGGLENWRPEECVLTKGYFVVEVDGSRARVEEIDSARRPGHIIPVDGSGLHTEAQINRAIKVAVDEKNIDSSTEPIVSVDLVGQPRFDLSHYDGGTCSWIISLTGAVDCYVNDRTHFGISDTLQADGSKDYTLFRHPASRLTSEEATDLVLRIRGSPLVRCGDESRCTWASRDQVTEGEE